MLWGSLDTSGIFTFPHKSMLEFKIEAGAIRLNENKVSKEEMF